MGKAGIEKQSPGGDVAAQTHIRMMQLCRDDVRRFPDADLHHLKRTRDGCKSRLQRVDRSDAQAACDDVLQVRA